MRRSCRTSWTCTWRTGRRFWPSQCPRKLYSERLVKLSCNIKLLICMFVCSVIVVITIFAWDRVRVCPTPRHTRNVKSSTDCCYVRRVTSRVKVGGVPWLINRLNSLPSTVMNSRQRSCNKKVGCLQPTT